MAIMNFTQDLIGGNVEGMGAGFSSFASGSWVVIKYILIIGVVALGLQYWYKNFFKYTYRCTIFRQIGGQIIEVVKDRMRMLVDEQGKSKFLFKKIRTPEGKATCPVPPTKYGFKMGKKFHFFFLMDENRELFPIELSKVQNYNFVAIPEERKQWIRLEKLLIEKKYSIKDKWKEWILPIMFMGTIVICAVIVIMGMKDAGNSCGQMAGMCGNMLNICKGG